MIYLPSSVKPRTYGTKNYVRYVPSRKQVRPSQKSKNTKERIELPQKIRSEGRKTTSERLSIPV